MADPKIRYDVGADVTGSPEIEKLARDIQQLDNAFDPTVAVRAKELADQVRQLGAQSAAIQRFQQLEKSVEDAGFALQRAESNVEAFAASLASTTSPTRQQSGELEKLNAAVVSASTALVREKEALDAARPALERLGLDAATLAQRERDVAVATAEARTAIAALGAESQRTAAAGEKLSAAWQTLGVRSFKDVQTEAAKVRASLADIQAVSRNPAEIKIATDAAKAKLKELGQEITGTVGNSTGSLITQFSKLGATVATIGFAAKPLYDLAVQSETLRRVLTQVTGSTEGAEKQIEFLHDTAQRAGVSVSAMSDAYVRFVSSARASGISAQVANDVFAATAQAAGNLGLSSEKVTLILDALGQMASKGVVSMEELRQQLGDALPGALGLMAKGLGLTQAELIKIVESGQLLSRDALPALASALKEVGNSGAQVEGLSASFNRFFNVVKEGATSLVEGPLGRGVGVILGSVAGVLRDLTVAAVSFNQVLSISARTVGLLGAALTGNIGSFQQFKDEFATIMDDAADKVVKFKERAYASGEAAKAAGGAAAEGGRQVAQGAAAYEQAATAAGQAATAHQQAATAATVSSIAQQSVATSAAAAAASTGALAQSTGASAAAAGGASVSWAKLTTDYATLNAEIERGVKVAEKLVGAKRLEGEAAVALAQASGNEYVALQAEATAAANNAAAQQTLAEKRQTEVAVLQAQLAAEKALAEQLGDPGGERAKQIAAIEKSIEVKGAEAEASTNAAAKAEAEAGGRSLLVKTYADNAAALDQLGAAYASAQESVADMIQLQEHGVVTDQQVADAKKRAADTERLYRDAVNDSAVAVQRRVASLQADQRLTQAGISVDQARAAALERVATAQGNSALATEAAIRGRQLEIESIEKSVAATNKEQDAIIAGLKLQREAIPATEPLLKQKQEEIDARIKNSEAAKIEAQARLSGVDAINAEIVSLQRRNNVQAASASAGFEARNAQISKDNAADPAKRAAENAQLGAIATTFVNSPAYLLEQKRKAGTLTADDAGDAQRNFTAANTNLQAAQRNLGAFSTAGYQSIMAEYNRARLTLEAVTNLGKGSGTILPGQGDSSGGSYKPTASPSSASRTININIGGKTSQVNVASDADANVLQNLLTQLADAKSRAAA